MITEDYVSFETAKLLKERGFNEKCFMFWRYDKANDKDDTDGISLLSWDEDDANKVTNSELDEYFYNEFRSEGYSAPTIQMAMKWLREVHKLGVFPTIYYREINRNSKHDYGSTIVRLDTYEVIGNGKNIEDYTFEAETYEETAEKAIKYCLENLI